MQTTTRRFMSSGLARTLAALCFLLALASPSWAQKVKLATTMGDIVIELDAAKAPKTVDNFVQYVVGPLRRHDLPPRDRQLHDPGRRHDRRHEAEATRAPIPLESRNGLTNVRGSVAMARTNDPNSATAQFFISVVDNAFLDAANARDGHGYAVFGKVVSGMDVVDKIRAVPPAPATCRCNR